MRFTSLDEIKSFAPCTSGWKTILAGQNKSASDSTLFPLVDCLISNTIEDFCWLIKHRKNRDEILAIVKAAKLCADSVSHLANAAAADAARYAADAAANVADAARYAAAANVAAADAANAAARYAAANAADAARYAADAAANVAADAAANAARKHQIQRNREFFRACLLELR